jgi:hypothetical protein
VGHESRCGQWPGRIGWRLAHSRRLALVAFETADALDIDAVEDHLELAGSQFERGGVGVGEVIAAALQAFVPQTQAVAIPVEDLEAVGLAVVVG